MQWALWWRLRGLVAGYYPIAVGAEADFVAEVAAVLAAVAVVAAAAAAAVLVVVAAAAAVAEAQVVAGFVVDHQTLKWEMEEG